MKKHLSLIVLAMAGLLSSCCSQAQEGTTGTAPQSDSAAVVNTIMTRRSVRKYQEAPVRHDQMDVILQCGINAPSGMNRQPWEIRVVDNPDFLNGCTEAFLNTLSEENREKQTSEPGFRNMFRNAPTLVFVAAPEGQGQVDCGLLGENLMLSAWSMGVGTCCLGGPIGFMRSPAAADYLARLDLPEGYQLVYAIAMGYPDESPEAKPRDAGKVKWVE